ncbi:MAG: type II toxin-antitoxin system MqsR family toxin [Clostridia bacterium]|nr:type II toxin-antitoxin system MqsR family toxin [Clostridia bacterium]
MNTNYISTQEEVNEFLKELKDIISGNNFNVENDLDIILKKKNENLLDPYTTQNTLLALDFDKHDIVDALKSLTDKDYIETGNDIKNNQLPKLYIFGKTIQGKVIYIKIKIRDKINHKVFCISFHFARYPLTKFPYNN